MRVFLLDLLVPVARALDMGNPASLGHHMRVAYIAGRLARVAGRSRNREKEVMLAAVFYDLGMLGGWEEASTAQTVREGWRKHAERGHRLCREFNSFAKVAEMIRYQRLPWAAGEGRSRGAERVTRDAHLLHLALDVEGAIDPSRPIYRQVNTICDYIRDSSSQLYLPELVKDFLRLADLESFWLDVSFPSLHRILAKESALADQYLEEAELVEFASLLARAVDFRVPSAVGHSASVAAVIELLAERIGFSQLQRLQARLAALLHDVGNLALDTALLNRPEILTVDDFQVVRAHSYYTYRILERMVGLEEVTTWCAYHHERADGDGYPFHLPGAAIPFGAKLLNAANLFCALAEERPHRGGMTAEERQAAIGRMGRDGTMEPFFAGLLLERFVLLEDARTAANRAAEEVYARFRFGLEEEAGEE